MYIATPKIAARTPGATRLHTRRSQPYFSQCWNLFQTQTWYVWHDPSVCVTWLICMCAMTRLWVLEPLPNTNMVCVTWPMCVCDITHMYVLRKTKMCGMTRPYVLEPLPNTHGVAAISRLLKNIGLFCKRAPQKRPIFCKRTLYFKGAYSS